MVNIAGRDYMQEKICQEFNNLGKDDFRVLAIVHNSKKYSGATFEEIISVVNEIVTLAEKCCPEGADPECYNTESLALSTKSCDENNPFPKPPGIAACCAEQGLERKLCLAALKHPPKEFPTYVELSNPELCEAYSRDPPAFVEKFLYEFATDFSHTPILVLMASVKSFLHSLNVCCRKSSAESTPCIVNAKLGRKTVSTLTFLSNKACSRYALLGKEKTKLSYLVRYTQRSPDASFEDVSFLAENATEVLSMCCDSVTENCIQTEVSVHTDEICNRLSSKDKRIADCCQSPSRLTTYMCIYSLPWAQSPQLPDVPNPCFKALCGEGRDQELEQLFYKGAQKYTRAPEVLLFAVYTQGLQFLNTCCSAQEPEACFAAQRPQMRAAITELLTKGSELCSDYTDHTFLEFKKRLRENFAKTLPNASEDVISGLVEQRAGFASTCCLLNAPPSYCGLNVQSEKV
ncbi:vitamin D-binding protein [Tiliqua scincoides]|uniref:vitamin D-binding protein n=1 Tax=Tiliqua scincoides TaxID=71010 RepID=UPI0034627718